MNVSAVLFNVFNSLFAAVSAFADMKLLLFLLLLTHIGVVQSHKNRTECFQCEGNGRCSSLCQAPYCIKTIHLQSNHVKRECLNHLTPEMPQPGNCKKFDSEVGNQEELICVCDSPRCNSAHLTSISIFILLSILLILSPL
uniref:Activin_recp domain-containing protein n=1 Tax=Bursaphelenchus xylophilus TaxID=6326 RepID=A0A1I7SM92_BURXY